MPETAAFLDALCDAFGRDEIHGQIRQGLAGEPVFYASENGHEIGTRRPTGNGITWDPVRDISMDAETGSLPHMTGGCYADGMENVMSSQTRVVHCKKERYDVYIGRPSKWGNPFEIGRDGSGTK